MTKAQAKAEAALAEQRAIDVQKAEAARAVQSAIDIKRTTVHASRMTENKLREMASAGIAAAA